MKWLRVKSSSVGPSNCELLGCWHRSLHTLVLTQSPSFAIRPVTDWSDMRDLSIVSNQKNFSDHKLYNISCPVCITNPPLPLMGNTLVFNQTVQIINDAVQPMASLVVKTCTFEVINLLCNHSIHLFS